MKIAVASDHVGVELKEKIINHYKQQNICFDDLGAYTSDSVDYPDYGHKMAEYILAKKADLGILICGTGIGISIAANRHKGIRAALLYDDFCAQMAKQHNNANIIAFGARTMTFDDICRRINIFLNASYEGGRHQKRIEKLDGE